MVLFHLPVCDWHRGREIPILAAISVVLSSAPGFIALLHKIVADMSVGLGSALDVHAQEQGGSARVFEVSGAYLIQLLSASLHRLYLTTLWIQRWIGPEFLHRWPALVFALSGVISLAIAIPLAGVFFRLIEQPFVALGRRVVQGASCDWSANPGGPGAGICLLVVPHRVV